MAKRHKNRKLRKMTDDERRKRALRNYWRGRDSKRIAFRKNKVVPDER
jgi:hypothetical protein